MGKRFAPEYANIFMAKWEEEVLVKCEKKPLHFLRYLDDIWDIWEGTEEEFEHFMLVLNAHDPSINWNLNVTQKRLTIWVRLCLKANDFRVLINQT